MDMSRSMARPPLVKTMRDANSPCVNLETLNDPSYSLIPLHSCLTSIITVNTWSQRCTYCLMTRQLIDDQISIFWYSGSHFETLFSLKLSKNTEFQPLVELHHQHEAPSSGKNAQDGLSVICKRNTNLHFLHFSQRRHIKQIIKSSKIFRLPESCQSFK